MKLSRFYELVEDEFGDKFAQVVLTDTRLDQLADQSPKQLLDSGEDPKTIWLAICQQLAVPQERWQGRNKTPRHAD